MRIGIAEGNINPANLPVELSGYGYFLGHMATSIETDLTASVVTLEDPDGTRAALCGVDTISVTQDTVAKIKSDVDKLSGGEFADTTLIVNASHTHSGPAAYPLIGAGGYNAGYVDNVLVPRLASSIIRSFQDAAEGEIGIARTILDGASYNRADNAQIDTRVTAIRIETERAYAGGIHFPCHPVVYGRNSDVISSDYPGYARSTLKERTGTDAELWLTGCCGNVNPESIRTRQHQTTRADVESLGNAIGEKAAGLLPQIVAADGALRTQETTVDLPVNTDFELDPAKEVEIFRAVRRLAKDQDLSPVKRWFEAVAPAVNENEEKSLVIPVAMVAIGGLVFAGFGAEPYSQTGLAIEQAHPQLQIVTMGTTNSNKGYIPTRDEYDRHSYGARSSSFIFGRKPLAAQSEEVFRHSVNAALANWLATA
ncbi:MAG TPA: neutral/alkaline non-lysosomal ceramidase N-terminal domain-containing protein [Nevskiaceae bacterium]|nr:neutral/alkaline non-lysosomal ceramidase N-terminal domain-containing protein [Nevskiaceae bacterium]